MDKGTFDTPEDMFDEADRYWSRLNGPGGNNWPERLQKGQEQADNIKPKLKEALETWMRTNKKEDMTMT